MEQEGWSISGLLTGRQWPLDIAPSVNFPRELGKGGIQLRGTLAGFRVCQLDGQLAEPTRMSCSDPRRSEERISIMMVASARGRLGVKPDGLAQPLQLEAGTIAICYTPEPRYIVDMSASPHRGVGVGISQDLLQRIAAHMSLPVEIRRVAEGNCSSAFAIPRRIDGRLASLMDDLMMNPYRGSAARLYQEAKGFEVMALLVDALAKRHVPRERRWKRRDVDLLHEARSRLVADLEDAPSLLELAQAIGMSATKVKRGFREVLGTTVSDTLRAARLDHAKHLIATGDLPLKVIAQRCGFCDASSLSHAFFRRFGSNPGELRRCQV
jgi:AraC-like DNA-binding protein